MKFKKIYLWLRKNFYYFIIFAFLGWLYEGLWFIIYRSRLVNRGFLHGPYLPIYGVGVLIIFLIFKYINKLTIMNKNKFLKIVLTFIFIFIIATLIEYVSHYMLDKCFNIVLWSYKKNKYNINNRVCLEVSLKFGFYGTLLIIYVKKIIDKIYDLINDKLKNVLFIITFTVFITDLIITIKELIS